MCCGGGKYKGKIETTWRDEGLGHISQGQKVPEDLSELVAERNEEELGAGEAEDAGKEHGELRASVEQPGASGNGGTKKSSELGRVVHTCDPSTPRGESQV